MKRIHTTLIVSALLSLYAVTTEGQSADQYAQVADSSQGYWHLSTNPVNRSTVVQFFNREKQVVYEEIIPGRYIELNDRTVQQLDQALRQFSMNQLVVSSVKTVPLVNEAALYKSRPLTTTDPAQPLAERSSSTSLYTEAIYATKAGKLAMRLVNPTGYRVHIQLEDERGQKLYNQSVVAPLISQKINMSEAPDGRYTLTIRNYNGKERYVRKARLKSGVLTLEE